MSRLWRSPVMIVGFLAASSSGAAILLHAFGWVTLTYTVTLLAPLTAMLFLVFLVYSKRWREQEFLSRLQGGLIAGALGLAAYDLVRLLVLLAGVSFNPFRPIEVYGLLILNRYHDTPLTKAVGWAFHVWNGFSFAVMYTMAVGRGRILWGLGWGLLLEAAMLASYPSMFHILLGWRFVTVSLAGHAAYGLTIGSTARKVVSC